MSREEERWAIDIDRRCARFARVNTHPIVEEREKERI